MKQKYFVSLFLILIFLSGKAQIGGETTYQFLELTNSARMAALGGIQVAINDSTDLNLPFYNPSLLNSGMDNQLLFNYADYFADINFGYVSYARSFDSIGNFAAGMHYINYGTFIETTEQGEITGSTFKAAEYALNLMYSNHYKRINYGIALKPILSVFESYNSFGLAADVGANMISKNGLVRVGLAARNIGTQITTYYQDGNREPIPFDVLAGLSAKLEHAPIVFHVTMHHLNHWDLAKLEPTEETDEIIVYEPQESFGKQILRHTLLGIELVPTQNFTIRAGYNYQRRQELMLDERASVVGFSFGVGVKVKRFRIDFGTSRFHIAGSSTLLSLAINLNEKY